MSRIKYGTGGCTNQDLFLILWFVEFNILSYYCQILYLLYMIFFFKMYFYSFHTKHLKIHSKSIRRCFKNIRWQNDLEKKKNLDQNSTAWTLTQPGKYTNILSAWTLQNLTKFPSAKEGQKGISAPPSTCSPPSIISDTNTWGPSNPQGQRDSGGYSIVWDTKVI